MNTEHISIKLIAILAGMIAVTIVPRTAGAHAFPSAERPAAGATINSPPPEVAIRFDNPIEQMFARVQVVDAGGTDVTTGAPALSIDRLELSRPLKRLTPGVYTVRWSVVSVDSHRSEGSFTFTVAGSAD